MTKLIPAEKLEALQLYWPGNRGEMFPAMTKEGSRPRYVGANDLRALIDAEPESNLIAELVEALEESVERSFNPFEPDNQHRYYHKWVALLKRAKESIK